MLLSTNKQSTKADTDENMALAKLEPEIFICNPYALEFLYLKDYPNLHEKDIEEGLVTIYSPPMRDCLSNFVCKKIVKKLIISKR